MSIRGFSVYKKIYDVNLDYLRGLLALYIVLYHFLSWGGIINITGKDLYIKFALYFVSIFFIISGYALTLSSINHGYKFIKPIEVFEYFKHRFARIYPLFSLVIIISIIIGYTSFKDFRDMFLQFTITFIIFNKNALTPGAWSIGIEIIFYAIFPIIFLISQFLYYKNKNLFNFIIISFIFILIFISAFFNKYDQYPNNKYFFVYIHHFYNHLYFFLIGIFLAFNRNFLVKLQTYKISLIYFLFIFIFFVFVDFYRLNYYWNFLYGWNRVFLSLSAISLFIVFFIINITGIVKKILHYFGIISYTIYLTHPIFHFLYEKVFGRIDNILNIILGLFIVILGSTIIYFYFEHPMRKLINNLKAI